MKNQKVCVNGNLMFKNVYNLFDDLQERYSITIDDIQKRKMILEFCNLVNREVLGLSELETYILRCSYGIYDKSVGSSFEDIGSVLGCDASRVNVIYLDCLRKICEFVKRDFKLRKYGIDSIYSLKDVSYFVLDFLENKNIIYLSDLMKLNYFELFDLFCQYRSNLIPMFNDSVVCECASRDLFNLRKNLSRLGINRKKGNTKVRNFSIGVK